jgi:hypothetical protein
MISEERNLWVGMPWEALTKDVNSLISVNNGMSAAATSGRSTAVIADKRNEEAMLFNEQPARKEMDEIG